MSSRSPFVELAMYMKSENWGSRFQIQTCHKDSHELFLKILSTSPILFTCWRPVLKYISIWSLGVLTSKCILRGRLTIRK